jgi:glucose dehydrogenase
LICIHATRGLINRGVAFWSDSKPAETASCPQRIFLATIDARLFALDAVTGHPCADFGVGGQIDLKVGISNITRRGEYEETSAPAVVDDLVIMGSAIADNDRVDSPNGVVRAFDARNGKLRWSWNPIQGNLGLTGAGNVWSTISVDAQRGLVFLPTGSASPDYHGNLPMEVHLIPRDQYRPIENAAKKGELRAEVSPQHGTPYGMSREVIHSPLGLPCNPPPWGSWSPLIYPMDPFCGKCRWV